MAHGDKSAYYQALKKVGYEFEKHYRDYTTTELADLWEAVSAEDTALPEVELPEPNGAPPQRESEVDEMQELRDKFDRLTALVGDLASVVMKKEEPAPAPVNQFAASSKEHAGLTQNLPKEDEIVHVDEYGNQWLQVEVTKPGYAKPRGRRVFRTRDPETITETIQVGEYTESFEVSGDPKNLQPTEIKVTLPSFQTGIYRDPSLPFKVHTYQGNKGFDFFDVQTFYGGPDLVPSSCVRKYVGSDLCYDISSVIRTIQAEYRMQLLQQKG